MKKIPTDKLPCLVFAINEEGAIEYANQAALDCTKCSKKELLGTTLERFVHPEDWPSLESLGSRFQLKVRLRPGTSEDWRWFSLVGANGQLCGFDIDSKVRADQFKTKERRELIRRVEQMQVEIDRSQFTVNQFLANMSHELRTPLTAILGLSEALEVGLYGDCSDDQKTAFHTINECGKSLLELINDILDVTKLETGKVSLHLERLSGRELANSVLRLHKKEAKENKIKVKIVIEQDDFFFTGDRRRLKQTLSHLLSNAIKFTQPETQVILQMAASADWVEFQVKDCGPGISAEDIKRIFQPFEQLETGLSRHYGGAGLGLNLVKKLVHLMNGDLDVRSRTTGGTSFTIRIPFEKPSEEITISSSLLQGDGLVLVVDDHPGTSRLLHDTLRSWGFDVRVYETAEAFQSHPSEEAASLILMDGKLRDGNGLDCLKWSRRQRHFKETPTVFLTASQGDDLRRAGLEAGAQAYLEKPLELTQLLRCVTTVLNPDLI